MIIVLVAAAVAFAVFAVSKRHNGRTDGPARILTAAARRLPAHRQQWAAALVAELAAVHGRGPRWAFAAGALRLAVLPPSPHPARAGIAAATGTVLSAAAVLAIVMTAPSLLGFIATLCLLLTAHATLIIGRSQRAAVTPAFGAVITTAVAGVIATVAAMIAITVVHPTATADHTHLLSILFAVALTGYLAAATSRPAAHAPTVWRFALTGAVMASIATASAAAGLYGQPGGISPLISPIAATVTLVISIGAAAAVRSRATGVRAGLLTVVLAAPIQFAITAARLLQTQQWGLSNPYDAAAYPHSGYPDIASYMISDALGGNIIAGVLLGPLALAAIALIGAAIGLRVSRATSTRINAAGPIG
jgi:hypothetical protein